MEKRKGIVEKKAFEYGVMTGKRLVNEVKIMRSKWDKVKQAHDCAEKKYLESEKTKLILKEKELLHTLFKDITIYVPKRINDYMTKTNVQVVDEVISKFNVYLKELTLVCDERIPTSKGEELLGVYNKLLDDAFEKAVINHPKGIKAYFHWLRSQHESIVDTHTDEEWVRLNNISEEKRIEELRPISGEFADKLMCTTEKMLAKKISKIEIEISKDRYNLKKAMSEDEFTNFVSNCTSVSFCNGVFSVYNKDSIEDIYPFNTDSAPLLKNNVGLRKMIKNRTGAIEW